MKGQTSLPLFQVDAFTDRVFGGNPAAVCPLETWLPDEILQAIAAENQLSETAFWVVEGGGRRLRWFTPVTEVDLCGHATLAAAKVLFDERGFDGREVEFETRGGRLRVERSDPGFAMTFPEMPVEPCEDVPAELGAGLPDLEFSAVARGEDWLVRVEGEEQVRTVRPNSAALAALPGRGVMVTSPGREVDFVSRFFAPKFGIDEDPVTGSAHCALAPYWSREFGRARLRARQVSARGGELDCEVIEGGVRLSGNAVVYLRGEIRVPEKSPGFADSTAC